MSAKSWATYGLQDGDLTALASIAAATGRQDESRVTRLKRRGFAVERKDKSIAVTLRGRLALLVKRTMMW